MQVSFTWAMIKKKIILTKMALHRNLSSDNSQPHNTKNTFGRDLQPPKPAGGIVAVFEITIEIKIWINKLIQLLTHLSWHTVLLCYCHIPVKYSLHGMTRLFRILLTSNSLNKLTTFCKFNKKMKRSIAIQMTNV